MNRRSFLSAAGFAALAPGQSHGVAIVLDPADSVASAGPCRWAAKELEQALSSRGVSVRTHQHASEAAPGSLCVVAAGAASAPAREVMKGSGVTVPEVAEALGIINGQTRGRRVLLACGHDVRGLVYALLELAERVRDSGNPVAALHPSKPVVEQPFNRTRSVTRLFCSDVEDKPWFNDREMWPRYLTMLGSNRFNRFNLSLGIGYDFLRNVTDGYFLFAYPFLVSVPGYKVRVPQLADAERDHNLDMLRYISEQTVARGLEFQLGIWMHGYEWINSPNPNYSIDGLTHDNHAAYCRDALRTLLQAVPAITGITFRIHGESGVEEGSYDFWKTVFQGVTTCGRTIEIDMHSKGIDETMLELGVSTGMPFKVSPKYWAEHMGMPYHQADIRPVEYPRTDRQATGLMKLSAGSRSFTRYGYADLLREDRKWGILYRIWPGTQRLLIWGDPLTAAAHARAFRFCDSDGVEIMEPLSFKGRRGSGKPGDRAGYADQALKPRWDWEKYIYSHAVWGRNLYNPETDPQGWRRHLLRNFGAGAPSAEAALANASRILPIVTTAHGTSAGNNTYWPEMYLSHSLIETDKGGPYGDTPAPRVFGNVSPMDPQLFYRINDYADDLLKGERSGKYTPVEVAQWLEDYAAAALKYLAQFEVRSSRKDSPEFRRLAIDAAIQAGLGRFFAAKFRSGVLYRIHEKTGSRDALQASLKYYKVARAAFAELAERGKVYVSDVTVGERPQLRGHWMDRLPAINADIAALEKKLEYTKPDSNIGNAAAKAIAGATGRPMRRDPACTHAAPKRLQRGQPLVIQLDVSEKVAAARLHYRHVNHAERFENSDMEEHSSQRYRAVIPATYTDSAFPLAYYFEISYGKDDTVLYPGFGRELTNEPYFVVRARA